MALFDAAIGLDDSYPAQPSQVAAIRRAVRDVARRSGADPMTVVKLSLAVSEAATNAVQHAYREPLAPGWIHVRVRARGRFLDVSIRDDGVGMSPRPDSPGLGMGLSLMATESDGFEVRSCDGGGTDVLLRFDLGEGARTAPRPQAPQADAAAGVTA